ncbi:conserved hypothetical protein [Beutenbergia cavernae DSM 12333]|uniref:DUF3099 domain-containing protein n=1 Tax=Beutenbergia cavernae (strain ATCC BAA-8 / DSM 12333 / CCUG 43141 / JCM 11478 / NBRC 16432 / NCIMB 13614 / HKI 0122) TaxID=471853 RepID=C5BVX3_BEUC1|nr:DUF3099 domain-containing protein [Beutenbergia cavernae]ACQ80574.1 conserved hypothetical protein [Beutenbergia cavernae DSM 12333]
MSRVPSITSAPRSQTDEQHGRLGRYMLSMGIRTACFLLAIVTEGWLRWTFAAAAIVLPYIAVVFANAGRERGTGGVDDAVDHPELTAGPEPRPLTPPTEEGPR